MERHELARAKVNLTLHITGQRDDGYHLLDSLVMFADVGDDLSMQSGKPTELVVAGREADGVPSDGKNSILKMANAVIPTGQSARFLLNKQLPTSAGLGGGTADAAAAFRLIAREWPHVSPDRHPFNVHEENEAARDALCQWVSKIGADVPVCLFSQTARMQGVGDSVTPLPNLPVLPAVLVNPRVEVSTRDVFGRIDEKSNPPMTGLEKFTVTDRFVSWLKSQRNDMQETAIQIAPVIRDVLQELDGQQKCLLARMSGSGATCFGLFASEEEAKKAEAAIADTHPNWWVLACRLGDTAS